MFSADVEFALNYEMAERKSQAIVSCLLIVLIFARSDLNFGKIDCHDMFDSEHVDRVSLLYIHLRVPIFEDHKCEPAQQEGFL